LAETEQRVHVDRDQEPSGGGGRARWIPLGLAVVAVIGLLIWLPSLLDDPATDAVANSTVPTPSTTVPGSEPSTEPRIVSGEPPTLPEPTLTGLGLLVWSTTGIGPLPNTDVHPDRVDGGYYGYFTSGDPVRSDDGLNWYFDGGLAPLDTPFHQTGRWGISYEQSSSLYELVDKTWRPVVTAPPVLDEPVGVSWQMFVAVPAETAGGVVVPVELWAGIPWGQVYGEAEGLDCPPADEACPEPWSSWNQFSETTDVHHPENGELLVSLLTQLRGRHIVFIDPEDGAEVWRISFLSAESAAAFFEEYQREEPTPMRKFGVFSGPTTSDLTFTESPFEESTQVLANAEGLFIAYENMGAVPGAPGPRVWTSADGVDWEPASEPGFVDDDFGWATIQGAVGSKIYATVNRNDPLAPYAERWESADGLSWEPSTLDLPAEAWIMEADFGYLAIAWINSLPAFWASSDGVAWEQIPSPEAAPGYNGYAIAAGVAGDLIYMTTETPPGGSRTFWSARFE
jgi:hypothetical protein